MNDKELAEEIARGDLVIAAANPQHRYVPLEIKAQIIAALRRENEAQARIAELEKAIQRVVETDDFDDLETDDGLWTNSARRFLQAALKDRA